MSNFEMLLEQAANEIEVISFQMEDRTIDARKQAFIAALKRYFQPENAKDKKGCGC